MAADSKQKKESSSTPQSTPGATPGPGKIYEYDWTDVHSDLENNVYGGAFGGNNGCYLGIAEKKAKVDLSKFHAKRSKDEYYIPELKELLDDKDTQKYWKRIVTFDPLGMTATNPTIASTTATLFVPEFKDSLKSDEKQQQERDAYEAAKRDAMKSSGNEEKTEAKDGSNDSHDPNEPNETEAEKKKRKSGLRKLQRMKSLPPKVSLKHDKEVVNDDNGINCIKAAIHYAWNIPALASRLELTEQQFRNALFKYTGNPRALEPSIRVFLPPVGGLTVYIFGDPRKIRDRKTEIAVRVHDECNGSDVFGTDICTCRPYLIFALKLCVEVAQRGGVGIIAYFRKEGRSLGEVTKYRVYNARKNQQGGDRPEKYFYQTESIAGIQDARFQTMMPDVLHWLGVDHIDWLLSMSSEKYEAITKIGKIRVNQRVALPDSYVPKHADIELSAKIMSGYHTDKKARLNLPHFGNENSEALIDDLRNLKSIRKQCKRIYDLAKADKLQYFVLNMDNLSNTMDVVMDCIKRHYPDYNVPLHSRFRHFDKNRIGNLVQQWTEMKVSSIEICRRLIDLTTISVLLDAGAGPDWSYTDASGTRYTRSEGLAIASYDMFMDGAFSTDAALKCRVNSLALKNLTLDTLRLGFQVSKINPMIGLDGRANVIRKLGAAMEQYPEYFGYEVQRPGNLLDYCLNHARNSGQNVDENDESSKYKISVHTLWKGIVYGMESIWPGKLQGVARGDVWRYMPLNIKGEPGSDLVPFHKLQQWLCYSLIEAMTVYYNKLEFMDLADMTCLAEYRNGGLFIDTKVLELRPEIDHNKTFDVGSELVVEWRAMTIVLADELAQRIRQKLNKTEEELALPKILEGGTWRAGRELAFKLRNGTPPINIRRDGTVF